MRSTMMHQTSSLPSTSSEQSDPSIGHSADHGTDLDFSMVLASSVHDMKNSLGMLLHSLEQIIESTPPANEGQHQHLSTLQYETSRINSDLIQLLNIYRLQQKNLPFTSDENYVVDTLEDQVARNHLLLKTKAIHLQQHCDPDLAWFYDNELVGNVIHNTLINAARYAKSTIRIAAEIMEKKLVISIEDDGEGFPDFMIDAAAAPHTNRGATDSTHLGLFFAENIARFHRKGDVSGNIELSNGGSLGGGVFSIFLP